MTSTGFTLTAEMRMRAKRMHRREADSSLTAMPDFELPQDPEVHMGGHGLYSTRLGRRQRLTPAVHRLSTRAGRGRAAPAPLDHRLGACLRPIARQSDGVGGLDEVGRRVAAARTKAPCCLR